MGTSLIECAVQGDRMEVAPEQHAVVAPLAELFDQVGELLCRSDEAGAVRDPARAGERRQMCAQRGVLAAVSDQALDAPA